MMKYYLMAPGPSMIPEEVLLEMAKPIIHHRTREFEELMERIRRQLRLLFQTKNEILPLACVGSGAMEAAITNCFSPGDTIIVVRSGKFGERWAEQGAKFGLNVVNYDLEWGEAADVNALKVLFDRNAGAKGILCQACETSTGVYHPIEKIGRMVKQLPNTIFLVDAITALGVTDIKTDDWGLDVIVTGSQKALMLPPGLSLICLSEKAWNMVSKAKLPRYYFDLRHELDAVRKNQTHFTPPVSLLRGLNISLEMLFEETPLKTFARHQRLAEATREAMKAIGLKLLAKVPSDSITAVLSPQGIHGDNVVKRMQEHYNFTIIGGQDRLKGKIFRLGHMGYCGDFDIIAMVAAVEMTLRDLGYKFEIGTGVAAATRLLHKHLTEQKS